MDEKSVVLIDAENIIRSWRTYCSKRNVLTKIDYVRLVTKLSEGTNLLRAYFYDGIPEIPNDKKVKFLDALQHNGIQLRTKTLKNRKQMCPNCNTVTTKCIQKGVDVSLATDILRHAWQNTCDICIVASGDEDYTDAIQCVKDKGIKVWIAAFRHSLSSELRKNADKVIFLEDVFEEIKFEQGKSLNIGED